MSFLFFLSFFCTTALLFVFCKFEKVIAFLLAKSISAGQNCCCCNLLKTCQARREDKAPLSFSKEGITIYTVLLPPPPSSLSSASSSHDSDPWEETKKLWTPFFPFLLGQLTIFKWLLLHRGLTKKERESLGADRKPAYRIFIPSTFETKQEIQQMSSEWVCWLGTYAVCGSANIVWHADSND